MQIKIGYGEFIQFHCLCKAAEYRANCTLAASREIDEKECYAGLS